MLRNEFETINAHLLEITEYIREVRELLQFQNDEGSKKRNLSS